MTAVLPFIVIIVVLVVVHEVGHFVTAKLAGVQVLEFGVGYPPRLFAKKFGETEYSVNILPLGGFVRLLGEEDPTDPRSLAAKPRPVRLMVLLAGSFMNFVLPILLFTASFMLPRDVAYGRPVVAQIAPGSPAEVAGLQVGDVIQRVEGRIVRNLSELSYMIRLHRGETVTLQVKRDQFTVLDIPVHARWAPPEGQGPMGIVISPQHAGVVRESKPFWEALPKGWQATWESLIIARNEVISWFKGGSSPQVAGPVGIAQVTGEIVEEAGWRPLLELTALLSINLAVLNILPLPMLDGGRAAFVILEILRRGKRISPQKEGLVHLIGFVMIITLAVIITYFDVLRILDGESLFR